MNFYEPPPSPRSTWFIDDPSGGTSSAKSYSNGSSQQIVPISRFSHCIWVQKEAPMLSINIGLQRLRTQNCLNGHFGTLLTLESRKRLRKYLAEMASGVITISMTSRGILSALWPNIEIEKWTNWQFGMFFAKWMVSLPTYLTMDINSGQMNSRKNHKHF